MGISGGTSEIHSVDASPEEHHMLKARQNYTIENEINQLFEAIDFKASRLGPSQAFRNMKRPVKVGLHQPLGIGIAEPVSLKQALRGLCISQASEMAATKRLSILGGKPRVSEVGTTKNMYRMVVLDASEFGHPIGKGKGKLLEISLVPESSTSDLSKLPQSQHAPWLEVSKNNANSTQVEDLTQMTWKDKEQKSNLHHPYSLTDSKTGEKVLKSKSISPDSIKSAFKNKNFVRRKMKRDSASTKTSCNQSSVGFDDDLVPCVSNIIGQAPDIAQKSPRKEKARESPASSSTNISSKLSLSSVDCCGNESGFTSERKDRPKTFATKVDEKSGSRHIWEFSQSSKSSIGECSSSTSFTEESNFSGSSSSGCRPHMSKDTKWDAIHRVQNQQGGLGLRHFKLFKKLGGGDIGVVYLGKLIGTNCLFAVKVMDNEILTTRDKMPRVQMEREILQMLDHPFLPTLYAHFVTNKFSCLVMDYCPGGDLHVLRQKQPSKSFSEQAVRFYVAEVLLALEYLHMLGVVYRDLKPEHIMIREDGHIMLTDFDLSLRCATTPTLLKSSPPIESPKRVSTPCTNSSCIDPFCLQPTWSAPCFKPRLQSDLTANISSLPQLIVEPTNARSNSFVGTHEYLAPEIIKSEGHGSSVDWWTLGVFLYELLYGRTPFNGCGNNEETLCNVVSQCVSFPESPLVSSEARDLMRRLLEKDPKMRLGSVKGAAEIKQHPFFDGLNWALIRCAVPPEIPKVRSGNANLLEICLENEEDKCETVQHLEFEMF